MKHVSRISRDIPASANILGWAKELVTAPAATPIGTVTDETGTWNVFSVTAPQSAKAAFIG